MTRAEQAAEIEFWTAENLRARRAYALGLTATPAPASQKCSRCGMRRTKHRSGLCRECR